MTNKTTTVLPSGTSMSTPEEKLKQQERLKNLHESRKNRSPIELLKKSIDQEFAKSKLYYYDYQNLSLIGQSRLKKIEFERLWLLLAGFEPKEILTMYPRASLKTLNHELVKIREKAGIDKTNELVIKQWISNETLSGTALG